MKKFWVAAAWVEQSWVAKSWVATDGLNRPAAVVAFCQNDAFPVSRIFGGQRTSTLSEFAGLASAFNSRDLIFMWYNVLIYVYNIYELEAAEATFLRPYLFHIFSSYSN